LAPPGNQALPSKGPNNLRRILWVALKVFVSAVLLFIVVEKTGIAMIFSTLRGISVPIFLVSSALYTFSLYISSIRWRLLLAGRFDMRRLFSLSLIGSFFNIILPGIIGGDAVKAYYLYKDTGESTSAVASVFMDRYIGFAALMCLAISMFPFGLHYFRGSFVEWLVPAIVLLFFLGSFIVFTQRMGKRFRFISGMYNYFERYVKHRGVITKTFFLSLLIQVIIIFSIYLLSLGLSIDLPFLPLLIFIPIISTVSMIPVSISGLGVREASCVVLFNYVGVGPVQATAISFAWFLSFVAGSLPGLVEYLRYRKKG
jgi:glycosyltransferase 2 family protein